MMSITLNKTRSAGAFPAALSLRLSGTCAYLAPYAQAASGNYKTYAILATIVGAYFTHLTGIAPVFFNSIRFGC